jgi:hypothetical protein
VSWPESGPTVTKETIMYTSMDEEVFLAPESIISVVLASEPANDPTAELEFDAPPDGDWFDAPELD